MILLQYLFVALIIPFSYKDKSLTQHWTTHNDASIDQRHSWLKHACVP